MPGALPETLEYLSYLRLMMNGELAVPEFYHNEVTLADKMRYDDKWSFQEQMTCNGQEKFQSWNGIDSWRSGTHTLKH